MPKDELGVEYDETVAEALKDPKSSVLRGVLDYFTRRREAEQKVAEKAEQDAALKNKPKGPFGNLFG
jgi:hypothetical protein